MRHTGVMYAGPTERDGTDPRPLLGEPLPLDLLNTHWIEAGQLQDLLSTQAGVAIWLRSAAIAESGSVPVDESLTRALRAARSIIEAVARDPEGADARSAFNAVLARGHRQPTLGAEGPMTMVVVDDPAWTVPWLAAEGYLTLLRQGPGRIRQCRHPQCVLWFFDTSRSGQRRWCSMSICGNRTKAERHANRTRSGAGTSGGGSR